ncbi:protein trichome berefringence-like 7 [Impatiens glandulifera]|uniref:protein trichome berefringence-like 7 n=1 Tax=Impatiens glandulifera TaxID=253017 RepID=UPI001FB08213|nr:protein trichome berefringence-like 7 [Impatiens glandulifera]XP_047341451.1 protein trichome berefringence-like 7 [Impatiens glandulifera]
MERIWNTDRVCSFRLINVRIMIRSFLTFILATFIWCLYLSKSSHPILKVYKIPNSDHAEEENKCNFFYGKWVYDETYPLYNASLCPFVEQGFNCLANGRRDIGYLKWRWQPNNCNIPRFDVSMILEKLRGKRVVFVGDSLSRTQWESMICMLMTGVDDKTSVYEVNGNKITKKIRNLRVRFSSYNLMVEFYRSIFLVQPSTFVSKRAPKRVKSLIQLDKLQDTSHEWLGSDVLIFNSAHWWTPTKLFEIGCYFQVGGKMKLGMPIQVAYRTALATLGNWLEKNIDSKKTQVFFRTFESAHWSQQTCNVTMEPLSEANGMENNPFSDIIRDTMNNLMIPVIAIHVTPMSAFRSDAHVGTWSDNPMVPDCSHWCLPGVPDTWNEILFAYILKPDKMKSFDY